MAPDIQQGEKRNLIIVSNRLPLSIRQTAEDGKYESSISSGGLVTSLSGLTKSTTFKWFGWPGLQVDDPKHREAVTSSLAEHNAVPIFLDQTLANEHYNHFSSEFLHMFHCRVLLLSEQLTWSPQTKCYGQSCTTRPSPLMKMHGSHTSKSTRSSPWLWPTPRPRGI